MYIVRADGNEKIGAGHLMRCMTIAEELRGQGEDGILFFCADAQTAALAGKHGFQVKVLGTDYRNMEAELPIWEELLGRKSESPKSSGRKAPGCSDVILVDSYYVTDSYLESLRAFGRVALLDDLGEHRFPVDCLVNYNVFAKGEAYRDLYKGTQTRLLLGTRYAPVRRQFLNRGYRIRDEVGKVLITAGGGDADNIAGRILDKIGSRDREYYLVTGWFNPHLEELKERERSQGNIHILHNVEDMAALMESCDLAITAGGSTVYELAVMGVPFICFSCAQNQEALVDYIGEKEIAASAGAWHRDSAAMLAMLERMFRQLIGDSKRRRAYVREERKMIGAEGAKRLAEALQDLAGGI